MLGVDVKPLFRFSRCVYLIAMGTFKVGERKASLSEVSNDGKMASLDTPINVMVRDHDVKTAVPPKATG